MSIKKLIQKENRRQNSVINLIASENYPSKAVLAALASPLVGKYAEGRPGRRYYFGNTVVDEIETAVERLVLKVFGLREKDYGVNVQPYSGSIANLACYLGVLEPGDRVLAMSLSAGGHLTHGHSVSWTGKLFKFAHYGVDADGYIDYAAVVRLAREHKPKLIICGASAYPRRIDFKKFRKIAASVDARLMADLSHLAGLVAGKVHPSPFPHCDIVTTTTHKTLRGPRGAIIFARPTLMEKIARAIFPGLQGGPQLNTIAAIGVCLEEALRPGFKKYARQIVANAKVLAGELQRLGLKIISGGTDNHLLLVDVTPLGLTGQSAGEKLERAGIIVNPNAIPNDPRPPRDPSGIRLGTAAVTTQGMKEKEMIRTASRIAAVLKRKA